MFRGCENHHRVHVLLQARNGALDKTVEPFGIRAKTFWDIRDAKMVGLGCTIFPFLMLVVLGVGRLCKEVDSRMRWFDIFSSN